MATETAAADRPRVVCLCGSTRFEAAFREAAARETMAGRVYVMPGFVPGAWAGDPANKAALDRLHLAKIERADEVLVVDCLAFHCSACGESRGDRNVVGRADPGVTLLSACCLATLDRRPYIGESTRSEIEYAERLGKPVRYLSREQG